MFQKPKPIKPQLGQESVWDYPRPPKVEQTSRRIRVIFNGETIADSVNALRVLETSHPPSYYIPRQDIQMAYLYPSKGKRTLCEFKGMASYWNIVVNGKIAENAAWSYEAPLKGYEAIRGYISFYVAPMDACYVDDEQVQPQAGNFYGGWITSNIVGPFKGGTGTWGW
ncbi:MAG: hypothetical protein CUN55_06505 [Phototrophicales bacterium]|nr:MAG: hypothetical protein CUN55_06505 [Phototrophicales bacterium]